MNDAFAGTGDDVPHAVTLCIDALMRRGMKEEGLFRVPGSSNEVDELKAALERGADPFAGGARPANVEAVATCLKLYLRELAEPVVPRSLYATLVGLGRITGERVKWGGRGCMCLCECEGGEECRSR